MSTWRRALTYFRPDLRRVVLVAGLHLLGAAIGLAMAWPTAILIDVVLAEGAPTGWLYELAVAALPASPEGRIASLAALTLLLKVAQDALAMVRTVATNRLNHAGVMRVRSHLFRKLQRLHLAFHRAQPPGELLYRLSQDSVGAQGVLGTAMATGVAAVTLIAMVLILGSRSIVLTALAFATVPLLAWANFWFERVLERRAREAKAEDTRMLTVVQQSFSLIGLVQAFGREADEIARFSRRISTSTSAWMRLAVAESRYWLVVGTIFGVGSALVFGVGGYLVFRTRATADAAGLTLGDLVVFMAYLGMLWDPLCKLTGANTSMQTSLAGMERVFEVLDREPIVRDAEGAAALALRPRVVELRDVHFSYPGNPSVLAGITCSIAPGALVAFVGPSGVGKSSLLSLLPRFQDPDSGAVLFDGVDARRVRIRDLRRHVALVLQDPILLPTTIAENIAYGSPGATAERIRAAADQAGVSEFVARMPQGFETPLGDGAPPLSQGQRQRIAIARALASTSPILVLDEPTSALDPESERRIMHLLAELRGKRTVVLVTHRLSALGPCDCIHVMRAGRIVESGTFAELLHRAGEFRRLVRQEEREDGRAAFHREHEF